jgi:hypothetical protein
MHYSLCQVLARASVAFHWHVLLWLRFYLPLMWKPLMWKILTTPPPPSPTASTLPPTTKHLPETAQHGQPTDGPRNRHTLLQLRVKMVHEFAVFSSPTLHSNTTSA